MDIHTITYIGMGITALGAILMAKPKTWKVFVIAIGVAIVYISKTIPQWLTWLL